MDANSIVVAREASGYGPVVVGALITGISIFAAAIFGYIFGLRTYFKRREHELILKRYLTEGIDRLSEHIDHAMRVFIFNHNTASDIVSELEVLQEADLSVKFRKIPGHPGFMSFHKLAHLVRDDAFLEAVQSLLIFLESKSTFLNTEFRSLASEAANALRVHKDPETLEKLAAELTKVLKHELKEDFEKFVKYSFIAEELQEIASILEKETTLTWDALSEFGNRSEIKQIVEIVRRKSAELKEEPRSKLSKNNN